jgi:xanthine dehydrogenase molybdopterin-binding subunit B
VVKVDPDTGGVKVLRYVIGYDIGRAINPTLVKGQIAGGFAQGLGGALMEEFTYNERGDPLAVTFADYLMPTVRETPDWRSSCARIIRRRSIRSASRARARAASTRSAPRSRPRSTTPSAFPAPSPSCR